MSEDVVRQIKEDIHYFNNMEFFALAKKFERDLNEIEFLRGKLDEQESVKPTE